MPVEQTNAEYLERVYRGVAFRDAATVRDAAKVRLGAELVTDFVIVRDVGTYGLSYLLIEIEPSWVAPFTKDGIASRPLNRAIHQILSWQQWLDEHRSEARKLFPSGLHYAVIKPLFEYCIVIGDRENSPPWLDRRNRLAQSLGIRFARSAGFHSAFSHARNAVLLLANIWEEVPKKIAFRSR